MMKYAGTGSDLRDPEEDAEPDTPTPPTLESLVRELREELHVLQAQLAELRRDFDRLKRIFG